ncbi:MAG: hypothetical protein ACTS6P_01285 [Candidatus Hodgkinia cicadicola]
MLNMLPRRNVNCVWKLRRTICCVKFLGEHANVNGRSFMIGSYVCLSLLRSWERQVIFIKRKSFTNLLN